MACVSFSFQLPMTVVLALPGNTMRAPSPVVSMCGVMLFYLRPSRFMRSSKWSNLFATSVLHDGLLVTTFYNARFIIRGGGC